MALIKIKISEISEIGVICVPFHLRDILPPASPDSVYQRDDFLNSWETWLEPV
jgi:hypothetical protein